MSIVNKKFFGARNEGPDTTSKKVKSTYNGSQGNSAFQGCPPEKLPWNQKAKAGNTGASSGNDERDFNRNLNSAGSTGTSSGNDEKDIVRNLEVGHVNRSDKKASEMPRLVANFHQLVMTECKISQPSNSITTDKSPQREVNQERRSSFPFNSPQKEQHYGALLHSTSEARLSIMDQNRQLQLDSLLATSVRNNLELLELLGKHLDKEGRYGETKCWKHLSQYFGVKAETYNDFARSHEHSPTKDLLEFLIQEPEEFTVVKLKDKLRGIERSDVEVVLSEFDDDTLVNSLYDSHPKVMAKIASLLDEKVPGQPNWKDLADAFGVRQRVSDNFGESIDVNPAERLFEYLKATKPGLTIVKIKQHLENLKMQDVLDVLAQSKKVEDNSPLKDLWEDLDIAASVCNLLNKKHTRGIRWWRHLGNSLHVEKDTLDMFSNEREIIRPTQALINRLGAARPYLIMADLIWALDKIGRSDVLEMIKGFFPDGHIVEFLAYAKKHFAQQQKPPSSYETAV